jgi:hypothetical protein
MRKLVDDDNTFVGPLAQLEGPQDYMEGIKEAEASLRSPGSVNDHFARSCLYFTPQSRPLLLASRLPGNWTLLLANTTPSS